MSVLSMITRAAEASASLALVESQKITSVLLSVASALRENTSAILAANMCDLNRMDKSDPKYDRLKLTEERIVSIAADMESVSQLPSPLGKVLSETVRPNGISIKKVSVPFGVVGVIYEARPNVTADVFSLCLRSGNAAILKGGSDADSTNNKIVEIIHSVLKDYNIDTAVCTLLPSSREATSLLLGAVGKVDVIIPRGSGALINFVRENSKVPVIETGAGICHTYFDIDGDLLKGARIINNAKTRRVSVCNALDTLIVHSARVPDLPELCKLLKDSNV
ncbi:MAG: glutamate-5-semialdehyde dehydrogenase, partial [Bacteroidales bacterium]|nr:glutamate-5-semialdehyde dehydrogenase [Bacteroidales bacterium]